MPTYPLPTLAAQVDANGITAPSYEDIFASLQASFMQIYGSDAVLTPDSQDGQLLAVYAAAINDANQTAVAVFNAFSPTYSQGAGLSSIVKLNGLSRLVPTKSSVNVTVSGDIGTVINNGVVGDGTNNWDLPPTVTIPNTGEIVVTATAQSAGAVPAAVGTVTKIVTPTLGWTGVTNLTAATPGAPLETDAALRRRQTLSTSLPAQTVVASIGASLASVPGVLSYAIYENDTNATDTNGVPAHSLSAVVEGGDINDIATAIALKKTPGTGTYGTTSVNTIDVAGVPNTIKFFVLTQVPIDITVNMTALPGYISSTGDAVQAALAQYVNTLAIGEDSYIGRLWGPADLQGRAAQDATGLTQAQLDALSKTYKVTSITQGAHGGALSAADFIVAFNQAVTVDVANITVNVT
jgi:uncharacterized phage protein gp47/JayE